LNCLPACFAKFAFGIIIFVFVQDLWIYLFLWSWIMFQN
jgi:hypothetical protein